MHVMGKKKRVMAAQYLPVPVILHHVEGLCVPLLQFKGLVVPRHQPDTKSLGPGLQFLQLRVCLRGREVEALRPQGPLPRCLLQEQGWES